MVHSGIIEKSTIESVAKLCRDNTAPGTFKVAELVKIKMKPCM